MFSGRGPSAAPFGCAQDDGWNGMTPLEGSIFNRFDKVVSRRAGIIRLIDLSVDGRGF
jgi:hypothetical protein